MAATPPATDATATATITAHATAAQSTPPSGPPPPPFPFLNLPLELREAIYSLYFKPTDRLQRSHSLDAEGFSGGIYAFETALSLVSRQIAREAHRVWRRENTCVKISTPWPSAVNHMSSEGLVPIVAHGPRADAFTGHTLTVNITVPLHDTVPAHTVVLLLDDLAAFAQTWYYSALAYPMLNDRLACTHTLRDPDLDDMDENSEATTIPLALQRKLLLPFGAVKGLAELNVYGFNATVKSELDALVAIPAPTLLDAVESAASHMEEGDALLPAHPHDALAEFIAAFHAIHILVTGRSRRVLADTFFHAVIPRGRYAGQTGMAVRVSQRLQLVSRVVLAYLHAGAYDDAAFWGMRSARIMAEAVDSEFGDFLAQIAGQDEVALIYARTGVAMERMLADKQTWGQTLEEYDGDVLAEPEILFKVARRHCTAGPGRVRAELEGWKVESAGLKCFDGGTQMDRNVESDEDGGE